MNSDDFYKLLGRKKKRAIVPSIIEDEWTCNDIKTIDNNHCLMLNKYKPIITGITCFDSNDNSADITDRFNLDETFVLIDVTERKNDNLFSVYHNHKHWLKDNFVTIEDKDYFKINGNFYSDNIYQVEETHPDELEEIPKDSYSTSYYIKVDSPDSFADGIKVNFINKSGNEENRLLYNGSLIGDNYLFEIDFEFQKINYIDDDRAVIYDGILYSCIVFHYSLDYYSYEYQIIDSENNEYSIAAFDGITASSDNVFIKLEFNSPISKIKSRPFIGSCVLFENFYTVLKFNDKFGDIANYIKGGKILNNTHPLDTPRYLNDEMVGKFYDNCPNYSCGDFCFETVAERYVRKLGLHGHYPHEKEYKKYSKKPYKKYKKHDSFDINVKQDGQYYSDKQSLTSSLNFDFLPISSFIINYNNIYDVGIIKDLKIITDNNYYFNGKNYPVKPCSYGGGRGKQTITEYSWALYQQYCDGIFKGDTVLQSWYGIVSRDLHPLSLRPIEDWHSLSAPWSKLGSVGLLSAPIQDSECVLYKSLFQYTNNIYFWGELVYSYCCDTVFGGGPVSLVGKPWICSEPPPPPGNTEPQPDCSNQDECLCYLAIYAYHKFCSVDATGDPRLIDLVKFDYEDVTEEALLNDGYITTTSFSKFPAYTIGIVREGCYTVDGKEYLKEFIGIIAATSKKKAVEAFDDNYKPLDYLTSWCVFPECKCEGYTEVRIYVGTTMVTKSGPRTIDIPQEVSPIYAGSTVKLWESGGGIVYAEGTVGEGGVLNGIPSKFTSDFDYPGYMYFLIEYCDPTK